MTMIKIEDVTEKNVIEQIKVRRELIKNMVGQLYPAMLEQEIQELCLIFDNVVYQRNTI